VLWLEQTQRSSLGSAMRSTASNSAKGVGGSARGKASTRRNGRRWATTEVLKSSSVQGSRVSIDFFFHCNHPFCIQDNISISIFRLEVRFNSKITMFQFQPESNTATNTHQSGVEPCGQVRPCEARWPQSQHYNTPKTVLCRGSAGDCSTTPREDAAEEPAQPVAWWPPKFPQPKAHLLRCLG
jgi:hypothetical protein